MHRSVIPLLAAFLFLSACHSLTRSGAGGDLEIRALSSPATLTPALRTAVYKPVDSSSADLYFSDLPASRLVDVSDDLSEASGSIVHIHYFLQPTPGSTPIDDTACNVTVQHLILAPADPGAAGVTTRIFGIYGGGGFFFPDGEVGEELFGGTMRDGTHRLIYASPGFKDVLGPATIGGSMTASRDDAAAAAIQGRIERALLAAIPPPTPPHATAE